MNKILCFFIFWLTIAGISSGAGSKTCEIYFDSALPQIKFAVEELKKELMANGFSVSEKLVSAYPGNKADVSVVITFQKEEIENICKNLDTHFIEQKRTQSYNIRVKKENKSRVIAVLAGDASGAMYGTFDLADVIRLGTLSDLKNYETEPFVENRGIKFNIPLDMRSPTYSDKNDASQQNIPEMWSMDFWKEMLDEMARNRYNIISLWSLHPFPSMVKVPEFPNVALDDVWRWKGSVNDIEVGFNGEIIDQYAPGNYEIIKKITIDEKIKFWQDVMQYGHERGISFYIFTWNIFTNGATGKYGIDDNQDNEKTIGYFRASTRELVLTYPLLAGIGVTAGDVYTKNMAFGVVGFPRHWRDELALLNGSLKNLQAEYEKVSAEPVKANREEPQVLKYMEDSFPATVFFEPAENVVPLRPFTVFATVADADGINSVKLRYRHLTQFEDYNTLEMRPDTKSEKWAATIPGDFIVPEWNLMYFIEVTDQKGNGKMFPDFEKVAPYVIVELDRN